MEKKTYEKPVLHAEQFTPNYYCANCIEGFRVKCTVNGSDDTPQYIKLNPDYSYWNSSYYIGKYVTTKDSSWTGDWEESNTHSTESGTCGDPEAQIITGSASTGWTFKENNANMNTLNATISTTSIRRDEA